MYQVNKFFSRRFFLLLIVFFNCTLYASYNDIYFENNQKNSLQFNYALEKGNYRVYLKDNGFMFYQNIIGFNLFIPNFVKSFDLSILRHNSIGKINGILSLDKKFDNIVSETSNNIEHYSDKDDSQLKLLLKNKSIEYKDFTYLNFKAENISKKEYLNLNKTFYFKFYKNTVNKLEGLYYSFYMILDKKSVDNYVKNRFKIVNYEDRTYDYLHTYILNLRNNNQEIKSQNIKKTTVSNGIVQPKSKTIRLNLKKLLHMKEFGAKEIKITPDVNNLKVKIDDLNKKFELQFIKLRDEIINLLLNNNKKLVDNKLYYANLRNMELKITNLKNNLSDFQYPDSMLKYLVNSTEIKEYLKSQELNQKKLDEIFTIFKKLVEDLKVNTELSSMINNGDFKAELKRRLLIIIEDTKFSTKIHLDNVITLDNCLDITYNFEESCLMYDWYFSSYVYNLLKIEKYPENELVEKYADYQILNDLAVYQYKLGNLDLSSDLLKKALTKSKNNKKILFNKAILLSYQNTVASNKEANNIYLKSNYKEAFYNLAINYYLGFGIEHNTKKAYINFEKAKNSGLDLANKNYEKLKKMGY